MLEQIYGVNPDDGIAMWVADMDFKPPQCVQEAVEKVADHGVYGYYGDDVGYRSSIVNWMQTRHNWTIDPSWIFSTHGLVNGTGMCVNAFTSPGDGVVLFTPVYHAFARVISTAGRKVVECQLANYDGRYEMDFAAYDAQMTGVEKMVILCSPHNPGGRVWSQKELRGLADFCVRHDLLLVSDEIHHDLIFPGTTHIPMANAAPDIIDRLITMTASTKTFNIAGSHIGNVIIGDPTLRGKFAATMGGLGISANSFGLFMAEAAYTDGAEWVDDLISYLDENRKLFDAGINAIPGLRSMPLESTYLAWVDFSGTGMEPAEFTERVQKRAKVVPNNGPTFGAGGENFLRFNIACPRSVLEEAVGRLQNAFSDLQ